MRTDSVRVADSAVAQARDFIKREFGKRYLPDEPVVHKGGKSNARVQDAHEAIRPTDVLRRPEELTSEELTSELQSLTNLVCRLLLEKKKKKKNKNQIIVHNIK